MFPDMFKAIILAVSLCADCFAVSLCSSVSLKSSRLKDMLGVAAMFAVIQTSLLLLGWIFGSALSFLVLKAAHIIGFLLLLYVGGGMLLEGIRYEGEGRDLTGWRNVILGGIATSIDALAVGVSQSIGGEQFRSCLPLAVSVFVVTAVSVIAGIEGGMKIGKRCGRIAEIIGGVVLIGIGVTVLLRVRL